MNKTANRLKITKLYTPYRLRAGKAEMSDSDFPSSEPVTMNNFKSLRMSTKKKPFFFLVKMHLNLLLRNKFVT